MNVINIVISGMNIRFTKIEVNLENRSVSFNDKVKVYSFDKIMFIFDKILCITKEWKEEYVDDEIIDGGCIEIFIKSDNSLKKCKCYGKFPENYYDLNDFVVWLKEDVYG